jgi:hypothetical protein
MKQNMYEKNWFKFSLLLLNLIFKSLLLYQSLVLTIDYLSFPSTMKK